MTGVKNSNVSIPVVKDHLEVWFKSSKTEDITQYVIMTTNSSIGTNNLEMESLNIDAEQWFNTTSYAVVS